MNESDKVFRKYAVFFIGISLLSFLCGIIFIVSIGLNSDDHSKVGQTKLNEAMYAFLVPLCITVILAIYCSIKFRRMGLSQEWGNYLRNMPGLRWALLISGLCYFAAHIYDKEVDALIKLVSNHFHLK